MRSAAIDLGDRSKSPARWGSATPARVRSWCGLAAAGQQCLRPALPDKWKGLMTDPGAGPDPVDLAIGPATHPVPVDSALDPGNPVRQGFLGWGPIIQQIRGGANARPFATHINAYDLDLRIAPSCTPQAALRRRRRARLRTGPRVSCNKGRRLQPQPGIHPAGGLPGARRPPGLDRRLPGV